MTDQPSLLDWTPAHQAHSPTSKAAAEAIKPKIGPMHRAIMGHLGYYCDATDEEMQTALAMKESTQRHRRRELQQAGYIMVDEPQPGFAEAIRAALLAKEGA